jgi:hypothetical protein
MHTFNRNKYLTLNSNLQQLNYIQRTLVYDSEVGPCWINCELTKLHSQRRFETNISNRHYSLVHAFVT